MSIPPIIESDDVFDFQPTYFQVGPTLFTAVRKWVILGEEKDPSHSDEEALEGSTKQNPIILRGVSSEEFKAYLLLAHGLDYHPHNLRSIEQYLGALKLANRWNHVNVRIRARRAIQGYFMAQSLTITPTDRITLARECQVQDWLRQGLIDFVEEILAKQATPTALADAAGTVDAVILAPAFFVCYQFGTIHADKLCGDQRRLKIGELVEAAFGAELAACLYGDGSSDYNGPSKVLELTFRGQYPTNSSHNN